MKKHFDVPYPLPVRSLKIGIEEDIDLLHRNGSASSLTSLTSFDSLHGMDLETSTPSSQRSHQRESTVPREVDDKGSGFCKANAKKRKSTFSAAFYRYGLFLDSIDQDGINQIALFLRNGWKQRLLKQIVENCFSKK